MDVYTIWPKSFNCVIELLRLVAEVFESRGLEGVDVELVIKSSPVKFAEGVIVDEQCCVPPVTFSGVLVMRLTISGFI